MLSNTEIRKIALDGLLEYECSDIEHLEQLYFYQWALSQSLNHSEIAVLSQLIKSPTHDGDIVSKTARDSLISMGLATRCCFDGQQGYQVATYRAFGVYNYLKQRYNI